MYVETCRRDISDKWLFVIDYAISWIRYCIMIRNLYLWRSVETCEWHKAINLNCKVPSIRIKVIHRVRITIHHTGMLSGDVTRLADCLPAVWHMQRYAFQASVSRISTEPASSIDKVYQLTAIVRGPEGSPQFYSAIISITVQLGT